MIRFTCCNPSCGKPVRTQDSAAGKKGRCPHCELVQTVPAQSELDLAAPAENAPAPAKIGANGGAALQPAKKMYREYPGADSGRRRGVAVNFGKK